MTVFSPQLVREMLCCHPDRTALHVVVHRPIEVKGPDGIVAQETMLTGRCDYCNERVFTWEDSTKNPNVRALALKGQYLWFTLPGQGFVIDAPPSFS